MATDLCFIHSSLDDAELTPSEFRVYCHLLRRSGAAGAYPSRTSVAAVCRLDIKTVQKCLNALVERKFITKQSRAGQPSIYVPTPSGQWEPHPIDHPTQTAPQVVKRVRGQPKQHPDHLTQSTPHKGSPIEGSPIKVIHRRFQRPSLDQIKLLFAKSDLPGVEAEKFFNYYESNGWKVGKNPMKSLEGAIAGWKFRFEERHRPQAHKQPDHSKGF